MGEHDSASKVIPGVPGAGGGLCTCSSRKIHTHPMEGHWKLLGGGGVLIPKFLEVMSENKPEFPGGGVQNKKPSMGGVWIFSGTSHGGIEVIFTILVFSFTCPNLMMFYVFLTFHGYSDQGMGDRPTWTPGHKGAMEKPGGRFEQD